VISATRLDETLKDTARQHAERTEWGGLRVLLDPHRAELTEAPELALLLAEADLHSGFLQAAYDLVARVLPELAARQLDGPQRRALKLLGAAAFELGQTEVAERHFQQGLALAQQVSDYRMAGHTTTNLGMIAHLRRRYDEAIVLYQLAVAAFQQVGLVDGLAEVNHNLALAWRELGQLDRADRHARRAIACAEESGDIRLLAMAHVGRAELYLRRGEPVVAEAGARLGAERYAAVPDVLGEADALRLAGSAMTLRGDVTGARGALDRAIALAHDCGGALVEAEAREARARLHATVGDWPALQTDAEAALALFERMGADASRAELARWYREARPR
jgi:tetratricopeptide (TPR) repeat protein